MHKLRASRTINFCLLGAHASPHVHTFVTRPSCCPFSHSAEWAFKAEPRLSEVWSAGLSFILSPKTTPKSGGPSHLHFPLGEE